MLDLEHSKSKDNLENNELDKSITQSAKSLKLKQTLSNTPILGSLNMSKRESSCSQSPQKCIRIESKKSKGDQEITVATAIKDLIGAMDKPRKLEGKDALLRKAFVQYMKYHKQVNTLQKIAWEVKKLFQQDDYIVYQFLELEKLEFKQFLQDAFKQDDLIHIKYTEATAAAHEAAVHGMAAVAPIYMTVCHQGTRTNNGAMNLKISVQLPTSCERPHINSEIHIYPIA